MVNKYKDQIETNQCDNKLHEEIEALNDEKKTRNDRLYVSAEYLMLASKEILPLSSELAKTFYDLGDLLLKDMTNEEKMSYDEMEDVLSDILGDESE